MKRFIILALVACLFFLSVGCTPTDISSQHLNYGRKAIEIVDQYLDYEISISEAYSEIEALKARSDGLPDDDSTAVKDLGTETYVLFVSIDLMNIYFDGSSSELEKSLLENRNKLAGYVGVGKR